MPVATTTHDIPPADHRLTAEHYLVAQETGFTPAEVYSRGSTFCRANPREARDEFDFDQDADRRFDEAIAECWEEVEAKRERERRDRDPFRVLDCGALTRRLTDAQADAARVVGGRLLALSVRIDEGEEGYAVVARMDGRELIRTAPLPEREAEALEEPIRQALFAFAAVHGREAA